MCVSTVRACVSDVTEEPLDEDGLVFYKDAFNFLPIYQAFKKHYGKEERKRTAKSTLSLGALRE